MKCNLVPCPECGYPAEVKEQFYIGSPQFFSYAHCTNPKCELFSHNPHFTGLTADESDQAAARSWNGRYGNAPVYRQAAPH